MPNFCIPKSAMSTIGTAMSVSSANIANVNTNGFKASRVVFQSGPEDKGTYIGGIYRETSPGPAVISRLSGVDVSSSSPQGAGSSESILDSDALQQANGQRNGIVEGSNTDLPREFAWHIVMQSAYSATAATIRALDELTGSLLNVKV